MSSRIHVVLHQTIYPSNIGAAVRAMGNMGAKRLILVDPQCEVDSKAKRAAVGCQEILETRTVYKSWQDFYANEGEGLRIGFTARSGKLRPAEEAEALFTEIGKLRTSNQDIYLVFGREDFGLSGEDVEFFHHTCTLRTFGSYTSLNLAQAVLLGLYVAKKHLTPLETSQLETDASPSKPMFHPAEAIKEWLEALGFDLSAKRINAYKVLNQLILRNRPSKKELRILEVVLQQNIRKLKEGAKSSFDDRPPEI